MMKARQAARISFGLRAAAAAVLVASMTGCLQDRLIVAQPASRTLDPYISPEPSPGAATGDPRSDAQWAAARIGLTQIWQDPSRSGNRMVTVAILSTGMDYNHEDLRANVRVNAEEARIRRPGDVTAINRVDDDGNGYIDDLVGWDALDEDGLPYDLNGAGTAAAGIIGAVHGNGVGIRGINATVSLLPVRYIDANGQATIPDLVEALRYAGAAKASVVFLHLANLRLAVNARDAEEAKKIAALEQESIVSEIRKLRTAGAPVVLSAGNTASDASLKTSLLRALAAEENVVVVTSVDASDRRPFIANHGMSIVDTAAPGESVLTTAPGNQYRTESGTFVAAAHVAGALALATSLHAGKLTYREYFAALISAKGSDPVPAMELETLGGNRLNVAKFLQALSRDQRLSASRSRNALSREKEADASWTPLAFPRPPMLNSDAWNPAKSEFFPPKSPSALPRAK